MFQLRNLFIVFLALMPIIGCSSGKSGFDVALSVTGMTRVTSIWNVMKALKSVEALEINGNFYQITGVNFPLRDMHYQVKNSRDADEPLRILVIKNKIGWRLQPDEPKYFFIVVTTEAEGVPKVAVTQVLIKRITNGLVPAVERLGFQGKVESVKPFDRIF